MSEPVQHRPATEAEAKALASPLRMRILRVCLHEAHTNKQIAARLGRDPATVLHHVRTLVDTGFLAAEPERRGARGAREVPYRATGRSWAIDLPAGTQPLLDAFAEEVALVAAETVHATRLGLRMDAATRAEFEQRLQDVFEEFRLRPASGPAWSIFVAVHPDPNSP